MSSKKCFSLVLLALCMLSWTSCGVKARIKKADKRYQIGEYHAAGEMYRSVYARIPKKDKKTKAHVAFYQGECYRLTNNSRAAMTYRNALKNNSEDTTITLRYAQVLQRDGKYKDASNQYTKYLETYPNHPIAQKGLESCSLISEWKNTHTRYKIKEAVEFNSKRSSTFSPSFIGDSNDAIIFCSTRSLNKKALAKNSAITGQPNNDIYSMRKNASGKWEEAEQIETLCTEYDEGVCSVTSDGKTIYFTRAQSINGNDRGAEIYVSNRSGGDWGDPQPIRLFDDSTITVAHPAINYTGDTLYFVSDAPNGYGGKDIWMAELVNGEWKNVHNLGNTINTPEDEMFPFCHQNGTLYFASNGHLGFGGLDLYKANINHDDTWSIVNMGIPFNSSADDFGICFSSTTEEGYFSSNRNDKKSFDKIYHFVLPELIYLLEGCVTDNNGEPLSDAYVRIIGDNGTNVKMKVKKDGTYRLKMDQDVQYVMMASNRGYLNQKQEVNTQGVKDSKTFTTNFTLAPISKPVTMDNIFYEFGKWTLTPESEEGLNALVKLLNDNPNITIEVSAHTDYVGNDTFNKELSEKRAQSVIAYLLNSGIESARVTAVGYGEDQPITADKITHNKYPFIPIGQVLTEEFVTTLTEEQQEIANQINRRTEFKVLKTTYNLY